MSENERRVHRPVPPPLVISSSSQQQQQRQSINANRLPNRNETFVNYRRVRQRANLNSPVPPSPRVCYICYDGSGTLIESPCECRMFVHNNCLIHFITTQYQNNPENYDKCTVCRQEYPDEFMDMALRLIENDNLDEILQSMQSQNLQRHQQMQEFISEINVIIRNSREPPLYVGFKMLFMIAFIGMLANDMVDEKYPVDIHYIALFIMYIIVSFIRYLFYISTNCFL